MTAARSVVLDAALAAAYVLLVGAAILAGVLDGAARTVLAVPILVFLPGYALVSALLPGAADRVAVTGLRDGATTWFERCALSVAASIALLVLLGVALSGLGVPLTASTYVLVLAAVTVLGLLVGVARRLRRPAEERYAVPLGRWASELRALPGPSRFDAALNVALVCAVVLAMSGLAYGLAAPQDGESYTQAALLDQQGDELVAANYTTALAPDEPANVTLAVANHEGTDASYTAVVSVERVRNGTVLERDERTRATLAVPASETRTRALSVEPGSLGDDLRLSVLLYRGDPPADPTPSNADQRLYLWLNVRRGGAS